MASPPLPGKDAAFGSGTTVRRPGRLRVMHPHVAELLRSPRRHARPAAAPQAKAQAPVPERARYACAFEDDGGVAAPGRLVWAKVRNHPWWPGQVFDAADASAVARARRRLRRAVLVAYFWDRTFAWTDAAALLPLRAGFPRLAAVAPVAAAVDAALAEVARRVLAGLSCCCGGGGDNEATASTQAIDNAGVRAGAPGAAVDAAFARRALQAEALLGYLSALATSPRAGGDRVDLAVAAAQLGALGRWKGSARGLPEYTVVHGIDDAVVAAPGRAKAKRRRPPSTGVDGPAPAKRRVSRNTHIAATKGNAACDTGDYEALELEDLPLGTPAQQTPTPTRIGKLMSRAAQNMSLSPVVLRVRATAANGSNCAPPPPTAVLPAPHMVRCAVVAAHEQLPPTRKDDSGDHEAWAGAGLVLNFSSAHAVPSARHLATAFSRFGPVKEVRVDNTTVVFDSDAHADEAFSGAAEIGSISASLVSFRVTSSLPAAPDDPAAQPQTQSMPSDTSPVEALR
jgi:hypothetical protein